MKQTIENTLKFMQRVDLKWWEVPAFLECVQFLESLLKENNELKQNNL